jgi:hypothetical protein
MTGDPITRRRKKRVTVAVLVVAILMSALVALALIYMARLHPGS